MKRRIISGLLIWFISFSSLFGQELVEWKGDTLIQITPQELVLINQIVYDREYLRDKVFVLEDIVKNDSILLDLKDRALKEQGNKITEKDQLLKKRDKRFKILSPLLFLGGILIGVLL